ncbi:MAG: sigma 54-interacting transcriptional regulator [candidate division KSB1 bacterium]|nr:sigma 54-interacting transcriptional regulator [candidate division KSB1 bacterium]MDZ7274091.1 sigma 54-interacting transcriptional regulator [candidate division KSB1 bacterium]MDZ7287864.1 sigma 54-interacting transcriptional regulator [candidate division KSB1 bacterium]MDZ7296690.1 sigma 54-interacting transcriptional regulator [candidate division KSB1 bacterium]MDZ7306940.1 sigma 54-interacting transcriptional regulator [candidate division KSB1 bacterium]
MAEKDATVPDDGLKFGAKVLLIGAGRAGSMLLRLFHRDPTVTIAGVVDLNPNAPGMLMAQQFGLPTSTDYRQFIYEEDLDLVINVTGSCALQRELIREKPEQTELIGGLGALFIWTLLDEFKKKEILEDRYNLMRRELERHAAGEFVIGKTEKMLEVANLIARVAPTPTTVLIRGESGTGKEIVARMIHQSSPWREKPLVTVNCTAFSPTLIESELFGYKKGAFTGATSDRLGLLEMADNGTVFLDEIGDMPVEMQAKLLRFLQSGEIRAVGGVKSKKVQVRIIAATNRNLEEAIEKGEFRADLFYRLNAFTIHLPPLRERKEDLPLLASHFLKSAQAKVNKRVSKIMPAALSALVDYDWPGNLRELENVIERAVVLTNSDAIDLAHLPLTLQPQGVMNALESPALRDGLMALKAMMIGKFEHQAISRYLAESGGNVSAAARAAKVPRRTFQRLMARHKIVPQAFK